MRNVSKWLSVGWLPASILFAQEAAVTVVFAPEHKHEARPLAPNPSTVHPMQFAARDGAIGVTLGKEFMARAIIRAGGDGRPQLRCARTFEEVQR